MSQRLLSGVVFAIALITGPSSALGELVVSGVVLAGRDQPLAGARVELVSVPSSYAAGRKLLADQSSLPLASIETNAEGRFVLQAPEAGAYAVSVRHEGRLSLQFGDFILTRSRELPPVIMPAGTDTDIRVVDSAGLPVAGAWVAIVPPDERAPSAGPAWKLEPRISRTSTAGTAALPLFDGHATEVEVFVPGRAEVRRGTPTGGVVRLPREPQLKVVLHVTRAGAEPLEGALLRVGTRGWPVGVTDSSGNLPLLVPAASVVQGRLVTAEGISEAVRLDFQGKGFMELQLPRPAVLLGRVVDAATGKGLVGALVAPAGDVGALTTTDEQGRFSLLGSTTGGLTFEAHARGYLPTRIAVSARALASGRLPALALEHAAEVVGRILGAGNQPLNGVSVEAVPEAMLAARPFSPSEPISDRSVSGPDGVFRLTGLRPSSRYELRASKTAYLPGTILISTVPRGMAPQVEMRLQAGRSAVGRVIDLEGRPLAGARVLLRPSRREDRRQPETRAEDSLGEDDPATARSGPDGKFQVAQCPAVEVDVEVRLDGYAPSRQLGFRVGPEKGPLDLGTLILRPGARLTGQVVNGQGRAVAGAEIFLFDRLPSEMALGDALLARKPDTTTGAGGSFVISDLPAGSPQHVAVRAEGFLPAAVRGIRLPTAKPVLVRLEPGFQLAGTVVDEQSQPVPRAEVGLVSQRALEGDPYHRPLGRTISREAVTDTNGKFVLRGAPEGRAVLSASAQDFVPVEGVEIELPLRDSSPPVVLRLRRGAAVWGRISTTARDPVSGARVLAGESAAMSDAEGFYRVSGVAEGEQRVEVQHRSYHPLLRKVQIEPGENRVDLELPAGTSVEGRVVDTSGAPVTSAEVRLVSEGARDRIEYDSLTNADGLFRVEPVAEGIYRLKATAPDQSSGELPQPVVVVDKEPLNGLEILVERGAVLSGEVLGLAPDELASVSVEARAENGQTRAARLDSSRRYQIRALAPGAWLVRAVLWQGQKEARARVVIAPADRELTRNLEFGRKLTLTGLVLSDEQPLADARLTLRGQRFAIERSVLTSFAGTFRFDDLESDRYWLGISKPDQHIAHNQWLELEKDGDIKIQLTATSVSGVVRNAQGGGAVAGAVIRLQPMAGPEFLIASSSQEDGSFHLLRVPPGSYRLAVSADGFIGSEQTVNVAAGEAATGLDFALQPTSGGLLQVSLAAGGVPQLVHLLALDASGAPVIAETRTVDPSGLVRLATLPPGNWQLMVSTPGAAMVNQPIAVPGEPVQVTLPPASRLHLRVPALAATDLLAKVILLGSDQRPLWTLGLGGKLQGSWPVTAGQATADGVPQGTWLLRVESGDGRVWTSSVFVTGYGESTATVE